jgi:hypothetical protein
MLREIFDADGIVPTVDISRAQYDVNGTLIDVRLLSVPHTGTRFTIKLLKDHGIKYRHGHFWGRGPDSTMAADKIIYDYTHIPAIIPLRKKSAVYESWLRRQTSQYPLGFEACWDEMMAYIKNEYTNCWVLRVDDPKWRDDDLASISTMLGKKLSADFENKIGEGKP